MAGRGRRYTFHGAFSSKKRAMKRERARPGSFIKPVMYHWKKRGKRKARTQQRYVVQRPL